MYDPRLQRHIEDAVHQLEGVLMERAPHLAPGVLAWLGKLAPDGTLESYFTHERRFPMLLLPWWFSEMAGTAGDDAFHLDLAGSTISGYLAIRLLDDALDGAGIDATIIPASMILQSEYQRAYTSYFPSGHPFWEIFTRQWYGAADFAADHAGARDFDTRVERRLGPALIPLAAAAHHARRLDLLPAWSGFLRGLARLEQLLDDITDWVPDAARGAPNLVTSYHPARAEPGEPLAAWVLRDGLAYTLGQAESWLEELTSAADPLRSSGVTRYLDARRGIIAEMRSELTPGLEELARLRAAFGTPGPS